MIASMNASLQKEPLKPEIAIRWEELYPSLLSFARRLVYTLSVQDWKGQEEDLAKDIVQETMRRMLEHTRKAECGEEAFIRSPECFMLVIAGNYCRDLKRRDRRLVRGMATHIGPQVDLQDIAIEHLYQVSLFTFLAEEIVKFPKKQRQALLIDLANRMAFSSQPTTLQEIFLALGVSLQEYQQPLSEDAKERARFAALLSCAYKRVGTLPSLTF